MKTAKIVALLALLVMSAGLTACSSMNKCLPPEETPFGGKFYDKK